MTDPTVSFIVNQIPITVTGEQLEWSLLRFLREASNLTGTKQSCDHEGACGACTVIINGRARRACLTRLSSLSGARVETIESLQVEANQIPHPLIQTVIQDGIFQCGYCAPGAILSAKALLDQNPDPSDEEIQKALSTVICRCAALNRMDLSVKRAAAILRGDTPGTWTVEDTASEERILSRITGKMKYTADLFFPGMVYARAVRAGAAHARIIRLDIRAAENMPGVLKVLTRENLPGNNFYGAITPDQPIFCAPGDEINHVADVLAVVVAETQAQADAACAAVTFELETLPVVNSQEEALKPGAPILHEKLKQESPESPNVIKHYKIRKGDVEQGFKQADVIVEADYEVPFVEHAYMEVECSLAVPEADGSITIYCGTQGPMEDRHQVASALGWEEDRIRIAHMFMGGGFGGKEDITGQIHAALGALTTGRPVKVLWTRAESLWASTKRHAMKMHYRTGAKRDGTLVAAEVDILGDTGPYASVGEAVLFRACAFSCGPYVLPHARVDSLAIHTNNAIGGAFRGYGSPQVAFASELQMEKLAGALQMDPFDIRLKNALEPGLATITGDVLSQDMSVGIKACISAVQEALKHSPTPQVGPDERLGIGIATAYKNVGLGSNLPDSAGAKISLEPDGHFLVRHGATDMGQGINDVMAMIAARTLDVPASRVKVHTADTKFDPPGGMTTASRQTFISGNATLIASQKLRQQIWSSVSEEFEVAPEEIRLLEGVFTHVPSGKALISLKDLASGDQKFECEITYNAPKTLPPPEHAPSNPAPQQEHLHFTYDFGAQAAMVAVNEKTGEVRVLKIIAAHDVGRAISHRNIIGQIEGAVIQGMGYALSEKFPVENGIPKFSRFKDLGLLRFRDLPEIQPIIVEDPHPLGPFGAKGMGELTIAPTAPAIVNAVHDAVGVWINDLPITKEKILAALQARQPVS